MKKNYLFGLLSLFTLLFAASCQEEDMAGGQYGDTATVTFQVGTPAIATRAVGDGTAVGNGGKLYVAVYEKAGEGWSNALGASKITPDNAYEFNYVKGVATATVALDLAKNKDYSVVFWAETNDNGDAYTIDWNAGGTLSLNTANLKANQESYDAFWAQTPVNLTGAMTKTIELKRPFAQLNIGTSDKEAAANAGIVVEKTAVTVKQIPTVLNLQDSKVDANSYADVTYALADIADIKNEVFPADKDNQKYLSLNYLLVDEKITVDVDFTYKDAEDAPYSLSFPSVPVQRNYRTNIYGTLLTNSANYTVEIKPGFGDDKEQDAGNIVYAKTSEEVAAALTADEKYIEVRLLNDIELPISSLGSQTPGSGEYKLGSEKTENITIDLNGKKLNITTSYWSAIGAQNDKATITIKNGSITSTGNSAGTWNAWDLRFSNCNYTFEDVNFDKAVALDNVGKSTYMKNVTITDTHNTDTYGLWITAEGQTVTLENCLIDMIPATDGRGIKIDEQYVDDPVLVNLTVKSTKFNTEEKAAILVKSAAGANITLENLDLTGVKADGFNAVWVDEDSKDHADKVTVTGGFAIVESDIVSDGVSLVEENVYNVWSAKGLSYFSEKNLGGVTLNIINDLDFAGAEFKAIIAARSGELNINGNGNTIKNAKVVSGNGDNTTGQASFFYAFPSSTLKVDNLKFDNVEVDADINGTGYAGVVVGYAEGNVVLSDVDVNKADVYGEKSCGALVGFASAGSTLSMTDCDVTNSKVEAKEDRTGAYLGRAVGNTAIVNCSVDDNFISVAPNGYANKYIGQRYTSCASLTIDGIEYVDTYYGLDNAVKNMTTPEATFLLAKGTFALPTSLTGKTLVLEGADKEATIIDMTHGGTPQYGAQSVTFKNLTMKRQAEWIGGFAHSQAEHYEDCIVEGTLVTYCPTVTATRTNFVPAAKEYYNVHLYSPGQMTFTECNFSTTRGRCIYAHHDTNASEYNITINGCTFTTGEMTADDSQNQAAIRLHTEAGIHGTLTINNSTATGWKADHNGGLWVEWNNGTKKYTNNFVKLIDGQKPVVTVTPGNIASIEITSNETFKLVGDFGSKNVSFVMAEGVENVVFDGSQAKNINELIITQNGQIIDNANDVIGTRSGNVTVQKFNILSQINVFACKTEVVVQENTAEALMIHAGNCDVKVLNNTIDANFESHPTYKDATNTWNNNDYGIALNIFEYNLWFEGNTITDAKGHAMGINGWEGTFDTGVANKIKSFTRNNITVNSTTKTKRAAFKVWDDETYASNDGDTNAVNATAQAFINTVLGDNTNVFNITAGYDHTKFCFYNVNTNE